MTLVHHVAPCYVRSVLLCTPVKKVHIVNYSCMVIIVVHTDEHVHGCATTALSMCTMINTMLLGDISTTHTHHDVTQCYTVSTS